MDPANMVTRPVDGLASALFSRVQLRVLGLLLSQPSRGYHLTEVINLVGSGRGAVQRELERLTRSGILEVSVVGGRKIYQANRQSPIFHELHGLILKTTGLLEPLRKALKSFSPRIKVAFVYGSVAKGSDTAKSDIDLLIIGDDIAYSEIYAALQKAEKGIARPVNPNLMTAGEWKRKITDKNPFTTKIARQPKLFVLGTEDDIKGIGQSD
jgi:predicted nucleotidyltransferase